MSLTRRLRGLLGIALTWGGIGAIIGVPAYMVVMRAWPWNIIRSERLLGTFAKWEVGSVVWGVAAGFAFAIAIAAIGRSRRLQEITLTRIAAWGAVAGAAFPAILVVPVIISGASVPYYGGIILAGALAGAILARTSFAIARRAPEESVPAAPLSEV